MKVIAAAQVGDAAHDDFVMRATAGTFLHTRRYRAHQDDRFRCWEVPGLRERPEPQR